MVSTTDSVKIVKIECKMSLFTAWAKISLRNFFYAEKARLMDENYFPFHIDVDSSKDSFMLSQEFYLSIESIASLAFAFESLQYELKFTIQIGNKGKNCLSKNQKRKNAGSRIADNLEKSFNLQSKRHKGLISLFKDRNKVVHFKSKSIEGVYEHPNGTFTAKEISYFNLELAKKHLNLSYNILKECIESYESQNLDKNLENIVKNMKIIVNLFESTAIKNKSKLFI